MANETLNGLKVAILVTSRKPDDIPAFNPAMIDLFAQAPQAVAA